MNIQEQEEWDFHHSTDAEWDRAEALELGANNPDQEWVLTDRDAWHKNPYYQGEPGPHPEDEHYPGELSDDELRELVDGQDYFDSAHIAVCLDSF